GKPEQGIWMEQVPTPSAGMNEVLIKVEKTAICGTDLHIYKWDEWSRRTIRPGLVIGHEFVGRIVELGPGVDNYQLGDRVSAEGHLTCGQCRNCRAGRRHLCTQTRGIGVNRDGAFAEYIAVPSQNLWLIPPHTPPAPPPFFPPAAHAPPAPPSSHLAGEAVLPPAPAPTGFPPPGISRYPGPRPVGVTDVNDYRLNLAAKMGATHTVNVK